MLPLLLVIFFPFRPSPAEARMEKIHLLETKEGPWEITAKHLTYNDKEAMYVAEGDVVITKGAQTLSAELVIYHTRTGTAEMTGNIRLKAGEDILTGERGVFDLRRQTGRIENGSLFLSGNHYYISGELMEKLGPDTYRLKRCKLTTCDGSPPAWSITASEVKVTIEGYGTLKDAALRVHDVPVFYVPYMIFPGKKKRQTGFLLPSFGYSDQTGTDIELPFFWAISDRADATFYQRYLSRRGYMQGVEFRYLLDKESKGVFMFDILSDRDETKDMTDSDNLEISPFGRKNSTRYWFRARADQSLPSGWTARLDADLVSDQDYLEEFATGLSGFDARPDLAEDSLRPMEERRSPMRRSALRLSRETEHYSLQAVSEYNQRPENPVEDPTPQPLAGLDFTWLPPRLSALPLYFSLDSDYDYVWREDGVKGNRVSLSPELRLPVWLGPYIEFEPVGRCTLNAQWYDQQHNGDEWNGQRAYDLGTRMSTNLERAYDVDWNGATRLKHRIRPELSYRYRARHRGTHPSPWFEPMEDREKINEIRFSLENFLDARLETEKGGVSYRQWATFNLEQAYDVDELRRDRNPGEKREPFLPLFAEMILRPTPSLYFRGEMQWDHYDQDIASADISLDLTVDRAGGLTDTYYVDYQYGGPEQESVNLWIDVNLVYGFSAGTSLERNLAAGQNISSRYWIGYRSQCWTVKVSGKRENRQTSVMVIFSLTGLGGSRIF